MATAFLPPSSVKPLPDCQASAGIVNPLLRLLEQGSTAVDDFAGFLDPVSVHGTDTLARIQAKAKALPHNTEAVALFSALAALHQVCVPQDWNDRLGEIVECVFERLMAVKYPSQALEREKRLEVRDGRRVVTTTKTFPIDVIAWHVTNDHGEALEVKKAVRSVVNDTKLLKKLRAMEEFKQAGAAYSGRQAFVGLGTLFDDAQAVADYLETMLGHVTTLNVLTRDTCTGWQTTPYL